MSCLCASLVSHRIPSSFGSRAERIYPTNPPHSRSVDAQQLIASNCDDCCGGRWPARLGAWRPVGHSLIAAPRCKPRHARSYRLSGKPCARGGAMTALAQIDLQKFPPLPPVRPELTIFSITSRVGSAPALPVARCGAPNHSSSHSSSGSASSAYSAAGW
jgi:hypothetical protein